MKHRISKSTALKACIQKQQDLIENFTKRVADRNIDAFSRNESASQTENRSGTKLDILAALENELAFAKQEMAYLTLLDDKTENNVVAPGAIVVTNHLIFFIAVSSEKVEVGEKTIFGISTKAPIYAEMKDLKKGDTFQFNDRKYLIEDLY
ncbi:hypothetical protein F0919_09265 [Taibaiella lutea]|uniref:3-oxoacyl-ACP synthase n=1 Tax=Taibaiella lutea TaxID=2608001 RepID=A0A5M6CI95_9BACT|nr:hypothetical protein [Taibaiella lutea]KAA5534787.1 hypothetical protein F0919_09265 [Taibaiella lutea]